ncbi:terminase TerL endonuclease subunit [Belnapia mucosa]|uniref:terminase TerL endonuclease subunit n=1 Tax=Belnapia mucosa TaxID=2804532 RepID=UPI002E29C1F8|nr:terminase TerL endonuclease subunit [Belnapia mucosa]
MPRTRRPGWANPSWGQAVQSDAIWAIMRQARNNLAQETAARTRHLNIWSGADEALFSMRAWQACRSPNLRLEDFEGQECHLGLDLASRTDLAALDLVFPQTCRDTGKTTYAAFARCYLNEVRSWRRGMLPIPAGPRRSISC